jgi:predicted metal-dependent HD superfamily phosphohydrolase
VPSTLEQLIRRSPLQLDSNVWQLLERAYATGKRHYHTLDHVLEVAEHFAEVPSWKQPREVFAAVLFHDAVYDVTDHENEIRSAALCSQHMHGAVHVGRVAQLIFLTAKHGKLEPEDVDADAALFLDCDMAILGSSPERFALYEQQVKDEYCEVIPPEMYTAGRAKFLAGLRAKERIFLSDFFHARYDAAARRNLGG